MKRPPDPVLYAALWLLSARARVVDALERRHGRKTRAWAAGHGCLTTRQDAPGATLRPDQPLRALPDPTGPDRPSERPA